MKRNKNSSLLSRKSIVILITGVTMLLFSCENEIEKIKTFSKANELPSIEAENYEMLLSDSMIVRFKLSTPKLIRHENAKEPYTEFPMGIRIEKYDPQMNIISTITSLYAKHFDSDDIWEARNNVVAVNAQGDSLKTEHLIWDSKKEKIYSEVFVKIIRQDQIVTGIGFESDQDLLNWEIKNIKGTIFVEVEE